MEKDTKTKSKNNTFIQKIKSKNPVVIIGIFVLVIVVSIVGLVLLARFIDFKTNTALEVDGKRITKTQYASLVEQSKRSFATEEEAKKVIIQASKAERIAAEAGIDVTRALLDERAVFFFDKPYSELNEWEKQKLYIGTLIDIAYFNSQGGYETYVYNVPFSINYGMYGDNPLKSPSEIENARQAAQKKAEEVRSKLVASPTIADQLVTELTTTEPYKSGYGFATNQSQRFFMTESGESYISGQADENVINQDEKLVAAVKALSPGGVSSVVTESANLSTNAIKPTHPYYGKTIPIAYQVYYLKKKIPANKTAYEIVKKNLADMKVVENE